MPSENMSVPGSVGYGSRQLSSSSSPYKDEKFRIGIIDVSSLEESRARDIAEAKLSVEKGDLKGLKGLFQKIWRHNLAREYYRQRAILEAKQEMKKDSSVFVDAEGKSLDEKKELHRVAIGAITERFVGEAVTQAELLHTEGKNKEKKQLLQNGGFEQEIKDLVLQYATRPRFDQSAFERDRDALIEKHKKDKGGIRHADNLLEVVRQIRQAVEHGARIQDIANQIEVIEGEARAGARTETEIKAFDKAINYLRKRRLTAGLINETTLAVLYSAGVIATRAMTMNKVASVVSFGATAAVGAGLAAKREALNMRMDRAQHARERAQGKTIDQSHADRRNEMEKSLYDMKKATILIEGISSIYDRDTEGKLVLKQSLDQATVDQSLEAIAEAEERIRLSDRQNIDLIEYSSAGSIERERTDLDILRARAKVDIRDWMTQSSGVSAGSGAAAQQQLATILSQKMQQIQSRLSGEVASKDDIFNKMKNKQARKAFGMALATGLTVGAVAHEAIAVLDSGRQGLVEGAFHRDAAPVTSTPLESLRAWLFNASGTGSVLAAGPSGPLHDALIAGHHYKIPDGVDFSLQFDGTYSLVRGGDVVVDKLQLDANGELTPDSVTRLYDHHGGFSQDLEPGLMVSQTVTAQEYFNNHSGAVDVKYGYWHDNDTPLYRDGAGNLRGADKNELGLRIASANDDHVTYTVRHMVQGGSYHDGNVAGVKPYENLKAYLLPSDKQFGVVKAIPFDVDSSGNIKVDFTARPELREFFNDNGHPKKGWMFQVDEIEPPKNPNDPTVIHSLATDKGHRGIVGDITVKVPGEKDIVTTLDVPQRIPGERGGEGIPGDVPLFIPISWRKPLEKMRQPEEQVRPFSPIFGNRTLSMPEYGYGYYGAGLSPEDTARMFEQNGMELDTYTYDSKTKEYRYKSTGEKVERSVARENLRIEAYLAKQSPEYRARLQTLLVQTSAMEQDCRLSINIPARMEGKNLMRLLDQYLRQEDQDGKPVDPKLFEVNILVNRKESEQSDGSVEVVNEWKARHPEVRVNVVDVVFSNEEGCVGLARKMLTDLSLMRSLARSSQAGPLYIETEDADVVSMDKRMVAKLVRDFDANPGVDNYRGTEDRQAEILQKNPLLFFGKRLGSIVEVLLRHKEIRSEKASENNFTWNRIISSGWNNAYTAEAYAQIGGYDPKAFVGEDMEIGKRISVLRGGWSQTDETFDWNPDTIQLSGLRASSSPRRFLQEMITNDAPYGAAFENQSLKQKSIDDLLAQVREFETIKPEHIGNYQSVVNGIVGFLRGINPEKEKWQYVATRAMANMGLRKSDYAMTDEGITIRPEFLDRLKELIREYKQKGKAEFGYRRQTSDPAKEITQRDRIGERGDREIITPEDDNILGAIDANIRTEMENRVDELFRMEKTSGESVGAFLLKKLGAFATLPMAGFIGATGAIQERLRQEAARLVKRAQQWRKRYPNAKEGSRVDSAITRVQRLFARRSSDEVEVENTDQSDGGRENRRSRVPEKWVNRINLDNIEKYVRRGATPQETERQQRLQRKMAETISRRSFEFLARSAGRDGSAMTVDNFLSDGGLGNRAVPDSDSNPETRELYRGLLQLLENFEKGFRDLRISDKQINRVTRSFDDETVRTYVERLSAQLIMAKDGYDQKRKQENAR